MTTQRQQVGIVGYGYVGRGMGLIFPDALIHDPYLQDPKIRTATREEVNRQVELAIISVPTPMKKDGSCDYSAVEESVKWLETPLILIKSTIPPGTTDMLKKKYKKRVCMSPEYMGEGKYFVDWTKYPDPVDPRKHSFMIIGGEEADAIAVQNIFQRRLGPDKFYYLVSAREAEVIKYMENSWGAMKVTFCNEFYDICQALGVSYERVREGWLLDTRVERMHTAVFPDARGFGGKCWPKDVNAIAKASEKAGYDPKLIRSILAFNERFKAKSKVRGKR